MIGLRDIDDHSGGKTRFQAVLKIRDEVWVLIGGKDNLLVTLV